MDKKEILVTRYGEMLDMIAGYNIASGVTRIKREKHWTYDEVINLR